MIRRVTTDLCRNNADDGDDNVNRNYPNDDDTNRIIMVMTTMMMMIIITVEIIL